jgi:hypothetical protein
VRPFFGVLRQPDKVRPYPCAFAEKKENLTVDLGNYIIPGAYFFVPNHSLPFYFYCF